ncbi:hypothetical protein IAT38_000918 [Cryptococcus sp. DSM 104549]
MPAPPSDPAPRRPLVSLPSRGQVLRALTLTQNTSALAFSVFLVPHLASPLVAAVGGLDGAEKTMMIARDLYLPLEPALVYLPLGIHLFSSLARRTLFATNPSLPPSVRYPRQIHQLLAYPLTLLVVSHVYTHRLIPSSLEPPISGLSPSEMGWEFVGYNLAHWTAWGCYLGLVGAGVWHAVVGGMKIVTWLRGRRPAGKRTVTFKEDAGTKETEMGEKRVVPRRRKLGLRGIIVVILGVVSVGLARVAADTGPVSSVMKRRYDAVFTSAPWSGLLRS